MKSHRVVCSLMVSVLFGVLSILGCGGGESATPENISPVAADQAVTAAPGTALAITLSATDADSDSLTYSIVSQATHGSVSLSGSTVTYTPTSGYLGSDLFTFKAGDGTANSNIATVSITVGRTAENNTAPVATDQAATTRHDTAAAITLSATDADDDSVTCRIVSSPTHGSVTFSGSAATYTPSAGYVGSDSFTYIANDGFADSNTARVALSVTNAVPTLTNQSVDTPADTAKTITFSSADADGDSLTYSIISPPTHGTVSISGSSAIYTPTTGYIGTDTFIYQTHDGLDDSNTGTITIRVLGGWAVGGVGVGFAYANGESVGVLADGSMFVTGSFMETLVLGRGETAQTILSSSGDFDIFLARYNADGTLDWARRAGGTDSDTAKSVEVLSDGSCLVTGQFTGTAGFGDETLTATGTNDFFLARYDADGTLVWVKQVGGTSVKGLAIGVLSDHSSLVTGIFTGTAMFGFGEGHQTSLTSSGSSDVFLAKYSADGTLAWAKRAGGAGEDACGEISALADGSCFVTGKFAANATFGPGEANATVLTLTGGADLFIAKFADDGSLTWAKKAGGTSNDMGNGVAALSEGSCLVTGCFTGTATFGEGAAAATLTSAGNTDGFLAKYASGGSLDWVRRAGGTSTDFADDVEALSDGSCLITGYFSGTTTLGPGETNATDLTSVGGTDVFLARYSGDGILTWAVQAGGTDLDWPTDLDLFSDGSCAVIGDFTGAMTFGSGETYEIDLTSAASNYDFFLARYAADGTLSSRP
jgi:uncharacterized delta-60 repeat protein